MKSIRISDEAYGHAAREAILMSRSIAQQLEHWVRLGAALESSGMSADQVRELLQARPVIPAHQLLPAPARALEPIEVPGKRPETQSHLLPGSLPERKK